MKQKRTYSAGLLLLSILIGASDIHSQGINQKKNSENIVYQIIYPEKISSTTPLKNPGIGIEQASLLESRNNKTVPSYSGAVGPRNNSLEGVSTLRYIRSDWVSLAPAEDEYHWTTLDNNINDAWSKGQQIGFSINCASPVLSSTYWQNVPQWFIDDPRHVQCTSPNFPEGCTYYEIDFTRCGTMGEGADCYNNFGVNHDDPVYIQEQLDLIEAIRLRYDNKEWAQKWAYLDMRNWGVWGEWQTDEARISGTSYQWPEPSTENKKKIVDAFLKFEYIPVIANYHDEVSWVYAMEQGAAQNKTVGWRTDGIDVTAYIINPAIQEYTVIRDGWKTGPIYGEVMGSSLTSDDIANTVLPRAYLWNMSGFNNKWDYKYSSDPTYKSLIDEFRAKGGYRLSVSELRIPQNVPKGEIFDISVKILNSGTAPLYRKFYTLSIKLSPSESDNDVIIKLDGDLTTILPNTTGIFTAQSTAELEPGDYNVSVGITPDSSFNPLPPPVSLANTTNVAEGQVHWNQVGTMQVGWPLKLENQEKINEVKFQGKILIYCLNGTLIETLPEDTNVQEWIENAKITPGIYLFTDKNISFRHYVGNIK